jgi:hypothetical protein
MKKNFFIFFSLFLFNNINGQKTISYKELDSIKGEITFNNNLFDSYLSKNNKNFKIGDTLTVRKPSGPNNYYETIFKINKFKKNKTYTKIVEGILFVILRIELLPKYGIAIIDSVGKKIGSKSFNQPEIQLLGKMICKECNSSKEYHMIRIEEAIKYGEIDFIHNTNKSN